MQGTHKTPSFYLKGTEYTYKNTFVIAEIGTSHAGNREMAKELIYAAKDSGADSAKFQYVIASEIIHPNTGFVPLPTGNIPLFSRFQELERPLEFYRFLKEETEKAGLIFLCTPFGLESAKALHSLKVDAYKVASPELNFRQLLVNLSETDKPLILSTGVSLLQDIENALLVTKRNASLLHCITSYPAPETEYNMRLVRNYAHIFGIPCGVSDHSRDCELIPLLNCAMGGCILEKHITLSNDTSGLDDPVALNPEDFKRMTTLLREAEESSESEIIAMLEKKRGRDLVEACLGTGIKTLAPSEKDNYERTNRSVHALNEIKKGEAFSEKNTAILRTEKVLRPGIAPNMLSEVLLRKASQDIEEGEGIRWEDLGERV